MANATQSTQYVLKDCGKHWGPIAGPCSKCPYLDKLHHPGSKYRKGLQYSGTPWWAVLGMFHSIVALPFSGGINMVCEADVVGDRSVRRDYPHPDKPGWAVELYMGYSKHLAGATHFVAARPVEIKNGYRVLELLGPHEERLDLPADMRFNKKKLLQTWGEFVNSPICETMIEKVKQSMMIAGRS